MDEAPLSGEFSECIVSILPFSESPPSHEPLLPDVRRVRGGTVSWASPSLVLSADSVRPTLLRPTLLRVAENEGPTVGRLLSGDLVASPPPIEAPVRSIRSMSRERFVAGDSTKAARYLLKALAYWNPRQNEGRLPSED